MKIFGYSSSLPDELQKMNEISIQASPDELRKLSKFILKCASEMDADSDWEHEHFRDNDSEEEIPDLVVVSGDL